MSSPAGLPTREENEAASEDGAFGKEVPAKEVPPVSGDMRVEGEGPTEAARGESRGRVGRDDWELPEGEKEEDSSGSWTESAAGEERRGGLED